MDYRDDAEFKDYFDYADLGLPLAYATSEGIVQRTDLSEGFINEAFNILLAGLNIEDTGFDSLEEMLDK